MCPYFAGSLFDGVLFALVVVFQSCLALCTLGTFCNLYIRVVRLGRLTCEPLAEFDVQSC